MTITSVTSGNTSSGFPVTSGNELLVLSGGTAIATNVQSGGSLVVSGGTDTGATISSGATETISAGTAAADQIFGTATVTGASATAINETVHSGGTMNLFSGVALATTVGSSGGLLNVSGGNTAYATVLSGGGEVELSTSGATLAGTLTFVGSNNELNLTKVLSATATNQVELFGFAASDKIAVSGIAFAGESTTFTTNTVNDTTSVTVSGTGGSETLILAGTTEYSSSTVSVVSNTASSFFIETSVPVGAATTVTTSTASGAFTETFNETLIVSSGGSVSAAIIDAGASLIVSGGTDASATISLGGMEAVASGTATGDRIFGGATVIAGAAVADEIVEAGGTETVFGSATGDQIFGTLSTVSGFAATLTSETIENGGTLNLLNGNSAIGTTVLSGGTFFISGADNEANNTTLSGGGVLNLASPKATISGSLTFAGGSNKLEATAIPSSGAGDLAVISGFSTTDEIVVSGIGANAALTVSSGGGNDIATISGTSGSESFIFSGTSTYTNNTLFIVSAGGVVDLEFNPNPTTLTISSGVTSSGLTISAGVTLVVQSGGTASATVVDNDGSELVSGTDISATISAGGTETVFAGGSATGGQIFGSAILSGGAVSSETVEGGGTLVISGAATATNTVLSGSGTLELEAPTATLAGSLTFVGGGNTLDVAAIASSGDGDQAVISGFSTTDNIVISGVGTSATLSFSTSGGNEVVTVSGGGSTESLIFSGTSTYTSNSLSLVSSGGAVDLEFTSITSVTTFTASGAFTETSRHELLVLSGGSVAAATVENGGSLVVNGGSDNAATILAGGAETVTSGSATGDQIYGSATVGGGAGVSSETVDDGGTLVLGSGATANDTVLNGGGTLGLDSPTATLTGSLTFMDGGNTLDVAAIAGSGDGDQAVISGFSAADTIAISGVGANPTLSFSTSGGNEVVTVSGGSGTETFIFAGTSTYTSGTLSLVTSGAAVDLVTSVPASDFNIQAYNPNQAGAIEAGPLAIFSVAVDDIAPTQMNEGFTEVDAKAAGFDLFSTTPELEADLIGDVEPVVIGPGGQLYLLDGHHTFTALLDSIWGASNPTVFVNVVANFSNLTTSEFFATMQANNFLLPLNDGVPETVNDATGAPIPTSLTGLTSDVYRGLEFSILKNKSSKLFPNSSNITGATGASTPGLDKMTGAYTDFLEAAAYQDADGGLGLPYLSPGDIASATAWNLNPNSVTTLPNIPGTVTAAQLPGFILPANGSITVTSQITNATLNENGSAPTDPNGNFEAGALAGNGQFDGVTEINAGTAQNPILIGTPNIGFIMQLGNDNGATVTLSNSNNTFTGGTSILAGRLIIAGDGSLGAAPTETTAQFNNSLQFNTANFSNNETDTVEAGVPVNVVAAVQADNGIIFNSLSEGNGTLTIGTNTTSPAFTSSNPFITNRPIAVGSEAATIDVNENYVELDGPLVTLGDDGVGLGQTTGFSDLTIDDLSSGGGSTPTAGTLVLSTPSPDFFGDIIIGNTGTPTVDVMSDAALGYDGSNAELVGTVELNGGTLQTGASFSAPERNINLEGGSQIDVDGNTTTWGTLTDVKRTIAIGNSSATPGAITFNNFIISQTAILQLDGSANGATYNGNETVTFTNGILQTADSDTLVLDASSAGALGTTEQVFSNGPSTTLVDGIAPVWIVTNEGNTKGNGPYDFVTYGTNGYVQESGAATTLSASTGSSVVELAANTALIGNVAAYALNTNGHTITLGTSDTLTIGDGTDDAGLILASGSAISGGTLAFGTSQGFIWLSGTNPTISSEITGANGLTFAGSGAVTISTAADVSGVVTIDSGAVTLSATNVFAGDVAGVELGDVKTHPAAAALDLTANNAFTTLNTAGSDGAINLSNGAALTLGDTVNNLSSTISTVVTESGTAVAGALTLDGSGLFDFSGGKSDLNFVSGSTIVVNNSAQLRVTASEFANANFGVDLNGADTQLQFAQNGGGQFANAVSGTGELHLIGGTLQITGTSNTYSGGTVVETGSTLDITTANLPTVNENITDAGGLIDFDQNTTGTFTGVISDGLQMGTGPAEQGSLDKDDSSGANSGNVIIANVQTYTGATYVEAGTLTLDAVNAIADSSGVTLGRVGGGAAATLALGANNTLTSLSSDALNTTSVTLNGFVLTLDPTASSSSDFGGTIVDGTSAGSLVIDGTGDAELTGDNTFTGGTTLESGMLELGANNSAGSGAITFDSASVTLRLDQTLSGGTVAFANTLKNVAVGDQIDLAGLQFTSGTTTTYSGSQLTVTNGTATETFTLSNQATANFSVAADNSGGVLLTAETAAAPTISGTHTTSTTSEAPVTPFSGVTIGDANNNGTDQDTLSITVSGGGTLVDGAGFAGLSGSNGSYALSGTAAAISSELDALVFTPVDGVPNTSVTTTFTLSDTSTAFASATVNSATSVIDTDPAVAPTISGTHTTGTTSEAAVTPFSRVTISDANNNGTDQDTLSITVCGGGTLVDGAGFTGLSGSNGSYALSGTAAAITSELDALVFTPVDGVPNTSVTTTLTLSDKSSAFAAATVNSATIVTDTDPAVAPTITGAHTTSTTSEAPVTPFSGVTVTVNVGDANNNGTDQDTLSITVSGGGTLVDGAGFTGTKTLSGSNGSYTLSGTAASITSELDALVFTPVDGVPNTSVTTTLTLSDKSSAFAAATVNSATSVIDTDPAVAPTISGTHTTSTTSEAAVTPFSGVTISDANNNGTDQDTLTISLSNNGATGTLSGSDLSGGTSGVYTLSGTAAAITSELDALSFKPIDGVPNTSVTTTFTLSDKSSAFAAATVNSATSVTDTDPAAAAPVITSVTPAVIETGQTVVIGTVKPGFAGATLSLKQTGGAGTLSLVTVNGVQEIVYAAPANVGGGILDPVSYTIKDQFNDVAAASNTVPVAPAGDTIFVGKAGEVVTVGNGNSAIDGRAGNETILAGNGSDVVFAGTNDAIFLGNGNDTVLGGSNDTILAGNGTDNISTGADSFVLLGNNPGTVAVGNFSTVLFGNGHDSVTAGTNATINGGNGPDTVTAGANSNIALGNGNDTITAGSGSSVFAGDGNDIVAAGGNVTLGNGADTVNAGGNVTLGDGNDTVTSTGANSIITLGKGNDTVNAGRDNTISLGNGNDTVFAGTSDTINLGTGHDTIAFGLSPSPVAIGNEVVNNFNAHTDLIDFNQTLFANFAAVMADAKQVGQNTVIAVDANDNVTLHGVALASLNASNVHVS